MNWNALGAIGELAGALAVVASLLYVARQVRQSNRIAQADAFRAAQMKLVDLEMAWSEDPSWMWVYVRIRYRGALGADLSPEERTQAGFKLQTLLSIYSTIHRDVELGILPPEAYQIQGQSTFRSSYLREVWPTLKQDHSPDFVKFFEERFGLNSDPRDSVEKLPARVEAS